MCRADAAYGFDQSGELLELRTSGELRMADGTLIASFPIDGAVDLPSGVDVFGRLIAFTVASGSGGFAVVIGDMDTGEVREVQRSDRYIGQARWSPDGVWLAMVGPDYRSLWVVSAADGQPVQEITSADPRLSGRFNSPSWIDEDTIAFFDAVPALVRASRETGQITVIRIYGAGSDRVPALPVALSQPPT